MPFVSELPYQLYRSSLFNMSGGLNTNRSNTLGVTLETSYHNCVLRHMPTYYISNIYSRLDGNKC